MKNIRRAIRLSRKQSEWYLSTQHKKEVVLIKYKKSKKPIEEEKENNEQG